MKYQIPKEIRAAVAVLEAAGFDAYLVGGCVRDIFIGRIPQDWDVTTNAHPEKLQEIFPDSFYENKFGTVSVVTKSEDPKLRVIEITPYRIEGKYSDKRHPDEIKFADTLEEDLSRRDFTINAMALKLGAGEGDLEVLDFHKGKEDLEKKLIRTVGDANARFEEDALRIMRAVRFASELGFEIEDKTKVALLKKHKLLKDVAEERIRDEFSKMVMSTNPSRGFEYAHSLGILKHFLPELEEGYDVGQNKHHIYTVWEHNLKSLEYAAEQKWQLVVRMSALFHDIGKPRSKHGDGEDSTFYNHEIIGARMSKQILTRLRFATDFTEKVTKLVRYHLFYYNVDEVSESSVRRLIAKVSPEDMEDLIRVRMCDRIGSGVPKAEPYKLRHFRFLVEKLQRDPVSRASMKLNGDRIKEITGLPQGIRIGNLINALFDEVLDDPEKNTSEYLEKRVLDLHELSDVELGKLAEVAKSKSLGLEEEAISEIKNRHRVK
jgi:tRNA nucleotidyltransferase (CCA-adding enzyme)